MEKNNLKTLKIALIATTLCLALFTIGCSLLIVASAKKETELLRSDLVSITDKVEKLESLVNYHLDKNAQDSCEKKILNEFSLKSDDLVKELSLRGGKLEEKAQLFEIRGIGIKKYLVLNEHKSRQCGATLTRVTLEGEERFYGARSFWVDITELHSFKKVKGN